MQQKTFLIIGLVTFLAVAGLIIRYGENGAEPGTTPPASDASGLFVTYRVTGGWTPTNRFLICPDGRMGLDSENPPQRFEGRLDAEAMRNVEGAFNESDFFNLNENYPQRILDAPEKMIRYERGGKNKTVTVTGSGPEEFRAVEQALEGLIKNVLFSQAPSGILGVSERGALTRWPFTREFKLRDAPEQTQIRSADVPDSVEAYLISEITRRQAPLFAFEENGVYKLSTPVLSESGGRKNVDVKVERIPVKQWSLPQKLSAIAGQESIAMSSPDYEAAYRFIRAAHGEFPASLSYEDHLFYEGALREGIVLYFAEVSPRGLEGGLPENFCGL